MRKHLCTNLWVVMLLVASSSSTLAQGIVPVRQSDGRLVFENAPEGQATPTSMVESAPVRNPNPTGLVYWSHKEHRWKPVPPASKSSMRAARSAAAEVRSIMAQREASGDIPAQSRNYKTLPTRGGIVAKQQVEPTLGSQAVASAIEDAAQ